MRLKGGILVPFLCVAFSVNPTNQLRRVFPRVKRLGSLKKAEARRATQGSECTSIRESRCFRVALQCLSSGGLFERVRELRYTRRQRLRMALVVGNVQIRDWERLVRNARHYIKNKRRICRINFKA